MLNAKTKAKNLERRIVNNMGPRERRQMALVRLAVVDLRHAVRSLESRAEWLDRRREPDPLIRESARREAEHCRRIALTITEAIRGAE